MNAQNEFLNHALGNIAAREFPADFTLLRPQPTELQGTQHWNRRRVVTILLIVLALAALGFVFYSIFIDPGLTGVHDAGLGSNPNQSALPSLPGSSPTAASTVAPLKLDQSQTRNGVTIELEWLSFSSVDLIAGFRVSGLPDGQMLSIPLATFSNVNARDPRGRILQVYSGAVTTAEFTSFQVINDPQAANGVDLSLSVPLTDGQGQVLDTFEFNLQQVPVNGSMSISGQFTHAASIDDLAIQLDWVMITPALIQAQFCYPLPEGAAPLSEADVQIQSGEPAASHDKGVSADVLLPAAEENGLRCTVAQFNQSFADVETPLLLSIDHLGEVSGSWTFLVQPSIRGPFTGDPIITPTPRPTLNSQAAGSLTANLLWAYADEQRVALEVKFDGWKDSYYLGIINFTDDQGNQITNGFTTNYLGTDPADQIIQTGYQVSMRNSSGTADLHLDVPVFDGAQADQEIASFHFDLEGLKIYPEKSVVLDQSVTANGVTIQLKKIRYTPSYANLTLCFTKPTGAATNTDWWPGSTGMTLSIGDHKSRSEGGKLLSDSSLGGAFAKETPAADLPEIENGRCVESSFPIGTLGAETAQQGVLVIPELELIRPEVVPGNEIEAANRKLLTEGIQVQQQTFSGNGGGGGGFVFTQKPAGMSDAEAFEKLYQALGYQFEGPWLFTFTLPADQ